MSQNTPDATERIERAIDIIRKRWKASVVLALSTDPALRFGELRRRIPSVSHQVLIRVLRDLERDAVLLRRCRAGASRHVEYSLTCSGHDLALILGALHEWAQNRHNAPSGD